MNIYSMSNVSIKLTVKLHLHWTVYENYEMFTTVYKKGHVACL